MKKTKEISLYDLLNKEQLDEIFLISRNSVIDFLKNSKVSGSYPFTPLGSARLSKDVSQEPEEEEEKGSGKRFLPPPKTAPPVKAKEKDLIVYKYYTEKSHVIAGKDTFVIKDVLKSLGMQFSKECRGIGSGWIYPSSKHEEIMNHLEKSGIHPKKEIDLGKKTTEIKEKGKTKATTEVSKGTTKEKKDVNPADGGGEAKPKEKKMVISKNKWGNFMEKETKIVFFKDTNGKSNAIGTQDLESDKEGMDSLLPLEKQDIELCIKRGWPYNSNLISYEEETTDE
jgi:hypothetical protein